MRLLVSFMFFAMSFSVMASNGETQTFVYDGAQSSIQVALKGEKTHTEYRTSQVSSICYRQDLAGYRTLCQGGAGYYGGYYGPRYSPYPYTGAGYCQQYPMYRSVSYPCIQTVQTPYEVKDFDVEAQVTLDVKNLNSEIKAGETFKISLNADQVQISASGSKNFLIVLSKQNIRSYMSGSVKLIDARYSVELIPASPVLKALTLSDVNLNDSTIAFKMGPVVEQSNIGVALTILKRRFLASKLNIINKELTKEEVTITSTDVDAIGTVDLNKLALNLVKGRYLITVKASFKPNGTLMNKSQFSDQLEASKTIKQKVR